MLHVKHFGTIQTAGNAPRLVDLRETAAYKETGFVVAWPGAGSKLVKRPSSASKSRFSDI